MYCHDSSDFRTKLRQDVSLSMVMLIDSVFTCRIETSSTSISFHSFKRGQCEVTSIECFASEEMGEDDHVPIAINVECSIKGTGINDQQIGQLKRAMGRCPVKRIITGSYKVASDHDDYIRTNLRYQTE